MALLAVTEAAARKALALRAGSDAPAGALRVRVKDGGCSGMRYELLFDAAAAPDDERFELFGLPVVVDAASAEFLRDVVIDFVDGLNESGFKIHNPNANETCGCGESFGI